MKKYSILAFTLVLTVLCLTGCRRPMNVPETTVAPTTHATTAPTVLPTEAAPLPAETATHATENATEHTGATNPSNAATDTTVEPGNSRARQVPRNR